MTVPGPQSEIETTARDLEAARRRRRRSIALALVLGGLVVIFYVLTIVKMGPSVFDRTL